MTVSEAILSFPGLGDTSANFMTKTLAVRSLTGSDSYSVEVDKTVNLAAADLYVFVGNSPDFSENKLSITYPREYYLKTAARLYTDNGEPEKANSLKTRIVVKCKAKSKW